MLVLRRAGKAKVDSTLHESSALVVSKNSEIQEPLVQPKTVLQYATLLALSLLNEKLSSSRISKVLIGRLLPMKIVFFRADQPVQKEIIKTDNSLIFNSLITKYFVVI